MNLHRITILVSILIPLMFSCQKESDSIKATGITLNTISLTLSEGESQHLIATISPSNATNKNILWFTDDYAIASVDEYGNVTAIKVGQTKISAKSDDGGFIATCSVTVKAKAVSVTGVTLDKTSAELTEGETLTLTATVNPSNASNKNVSWESSDKAIATVDASGKVTAVKTGTATITVKTEDGSKTASCSLTVKAKTVSVTGVTLDKTAAELTEGETLTLTATVNPSNASNKNVSWESSDNTIATVNANGQVAAVKAGIAAITVKTEDGNMTASCSLTVKAKTVSVTGVTLDKTSAELTEGETLTLTATVNPSNASNKNVSWESSDKAIATVDASGKVTAVKTGTATITVKTEDGSKTASCSLTVKAKTVSVTGVTLDKIAAELTEGETLTLTATVNPSNASNKNVSWESSDNTIATVNANGKVAAVKAGTATITVKTEDGGKTSSCSINVNASKDGGIDDYNHEIINW